MIGRGLGRVSRLALVISLAVNVAVLGAIAARFVDARDGRGPGFRGPVAPFVLALPADARRPLIGDLRRLRDGGPRFGLDPILATITAEPFDPDAVRHAFEAQRVRATRRLVAAETLLIEALATLGPDERRVYAERLDRMVSRRTGQR